MNIKVFFRIIKNLLKFYWHIMAISIVILWVLLSYIASLTAWKAVFLDNSQVYFGRYFHIPFTRFATLRDVYFLRAGATPEEAATVVPLNNEPHGPKSLMKINVDHIIDIQILRNDSPLVNTIEASNAKK